MRIFLTRIGFLVGGWTNPIEKYARQIRSISQVGVKIKNIWNHHPGLFCQQNVFLGMKLKSFKQIATSGSSPTTITYMFFHIEGI